MFLIQAKCENHSLETMELGDESNIAIESGANISGTDTTRKRFTRSESETKLAVTRNIWSNNIRFESVCENLDRSKKWQGIGIQTRNRKERVRDWESNRGTGKEYENIQGEWKVRKKCE